MNNGDDLVDTQARDKLFTSDIPHSGLSAGRGSVWNTSKIAFDIHF